MVSPTKNVHYTHYTGNILTTQKEKTSIERIY